MNEINHICFIVPNYPTKEDPVYTFVRELICSIADLGVKCTVIAPQSLTNFITKKERKRPFEWNDITEGNNVINIFQPIHAPFLNFKFLGRSLSGLFSEWAYKRAFKKTQDRPNILYAHFWHSGVIAGSLGKKYDLPVFIATGESKIWVQEIYRRNKINKSLKNVKGIIAVSSKNKEESQELKLATEEKIKVIPNSVDTKVFRSMDKEDIRKKLGFKDQDFIVAYVGAFTHRKGILRLSEAIKKDEGTKSIFIGSGDLEPDCEEILYKGRIHHNQLPLYLNAADVFVLPTLAEGCSNAIIEAMACGLPIVSSDLSFNDDILKKGYSIRIDSENINQINNAIEYLYKNPQVRMEMSRKALEAAQEFDIEERAKRIVRFMKDSY